MGEIVYYHLPGEKRFSLDFVNPNLEMVESRRQGYDETVETTMESYELDETVYALYSRSGPNASVDDLKYEFRVAFEGMDRATRIIARRVFNIFEGVVERSHEKGGRPLEAYKYVKIEAIPEAIRWVDWTGTVPEVSGQLISNLILRHALPNANHRTAFGVLELYLKAVDNSFSMPSMGTESYDWQAWVDPFIVDSKRLLTVRRNTTTFGYLQGFGCDVVERKGGIRIGLDNFDLDMTHHDALEEYAWRHEARSAEFVETLLRRENRVEIAGRDGIGKLAFASWLEQIEDS